MSNTAKITHVQRTRDDSWRFLYSDGDCWWGGSDLSLRKLLDASGQTLDIPADVWPGWVGIPKDLPRPEPLPDLWVNVYDLPAFLDWPSRARADAQASPERLAVLHVWTDADGVDHAEIERVTP